MIPSLDRRSTSAILVVLLLSLAPASAQTADSGASNACGGAGPVRPTAIAATHTAPPYPAESQRLEEEGAIILRVLIAPDGSVAEDSIVQSSGFERLDARALDHVKKNYRWLPLPNCKTPLSVALQVSFTLASTYAARISQSRLAGLVRTIVANPQDFPENMNGVHTLTLLMAVLEKDGSLSQVSILHGGGVAVLDVRSLELVRARRDIVPSQIGGSANGSVIFIAVQWTSPGMRPVDLEDYVGGLEFFLER